MPFSAQIYRERRRRLAEKTREGIAIIPTASEQIRSRDSDFPFRPVSYFYYLTGFAEPEAVLVIIAGEHERSILFCLKRDIKEEQWFGHRLGLEGAKKVLGVDEVIRLALWIKKCLGF